jgi:hypothetical protein
LPTSASHRLFPQRGGETRLAYHVVCFTEQQGGVDPGPWNYFIDAKTGVIKFTSDELINRPGWRATW